MFSLLPHLFVGDQRLSTLLCGESGTRLLLQQKGPVQRSQIPIQQSTYPRFRCSFEIEGAFSVCSQLFFPHRRVHRGFGPLGLSHFTMKYCDDPDVSRNYQGTPWCVVYPYDNKKVWRLRRRWRFVRGNQRNGKFVSGICTDFFGCVWEFPQRRIFFKLLWL